MSQSPPVEDTPTISVAIPIRNRSGVRVDNCLRSLRAQQLAPGDTMEIVLSDYGSDPSHRAAIERTAELFGARHVYSAYGGHWNRSRALNIATDAARGHFVFCTDVDMIFSPDFVATVLEELRDSGGRGMIVCRCRDLPEELPERPWQPEDFPYLLERASMRATNGTGACQAAERAWFLRVGGYDERYEHWGFEDSDMLCRARRDGRDVRWIHDRTAMLHQWHPTTKHRFVWRREVNRWRYFTTRWFVHKPRQR